MKTQAEVRDNFWVTYGLEYQSERRTKKRQNDYRTDIRCAFVQYVDDLHRDGIISDKLAQRVTL